MELFNQGLTLMTYGISTVFIFLCLLIGAMTLMSSILSKLPAQESAQEPQQSSLNTTNSNSKTVDAGLLKVLQAAVTEHRNRKSV